MRARSQQVGAYHMELRHFSISPYLGWCSNSVTYYKNRYADSSGFLAVNFGAVCLMFLVYSRLSCT